MNQLDHSEFIKKHEGESVCDKKPSLSICSFEKVSGKVAIACLVLTILLFGASFVDGFGWALFATYLPIAIGSAAATIWLAGTTCKTKWGDPILLSAIIQASHAARMITDNEGRIVYANKDFASLVHTKTPSDLVEAAKLFAQPDVAAKALSDILAAMEQGIYEPKLLCLNDIGGQERWIRAKAIPIENPRGYAHWRLEDITQAHHKANAAQEEHMRLVDFADNAPVGFFSLNDEGRFLFANATLARWLGQDLDSLMKFGRFHSYMLRPPSSENANPYDILEGASSRQTAEVRLKGAGGKSFLAAISQTITRDSDGNIRTRGVVHDLTEQKSMSAALQASQDRFQRLFECSPVGIVILDANCMIDSCNQSFAEMIGCDIKDVSGQHIWALLDEHDRESAVKTIDEIKKCKDNDCSQEVKLNGKNGVVITSMHVRTLESQVSDKGANIVLHFINMTQRRTLEDQFAQSQKMQAIGQLAGGIAHDFNNLLTAMVGFCDLLLLRHRPGDPSFSDIMQIKQNTNRASNLVRQILAFSRQQTLRPKVLDITEVLTELSHLLRRLLGSNINLDINHGRELWLVKVDYIQLEQVLINLAVNARDAMSDGGDLMISTENVATKDITHLATNESMPEGNWVCITVSDTGCGMDKDTISRIFEPFFTTKPSGQGTGLGLSTVYGIIRQTDGYLDVISTQGQGTKFKVYIPRADEKDKDSDYENEASVQEEDSRADLTGSDQILLVEDEDAVRAFSQRALEGKGYNVLSAACGPDAISLLDKRDISPDLLITDVVMPEMDGPTLSKILLERFPRLKVIFISGYTEDKLANHMGERIWFLPKPFTLRQLAAKVKDVLDTVS